MDFDIRNRRYSVLRLLKFLTGEEQKTFLDYATEKSFLNCLEPSVQVFVSSPKLYDQIRKQALRRDGWRCQSCGARSNLEGHHKRFRIQSGHDAEENLITLCSTCPSQIHNRPAN
jgi:hypothetical protein